MGINPNPTDPILDSLLRAKNGVLRNNIGVIVLLMATMSSQNTRTGEILCYIATDQ